MKYLIPLALSTCITSNANAYEYNWDAWNYANTLTNQSDFNEILTDFDSIFTTAGLYTWDSWLSSFEQALHNHAMDDNGRFSTNGSNIISNTGSGTIDSTSAYNHFQSAIADLNTAQNAAYNCYLSIACINLTTYGKQLDLDDDGDVDYNDYSGLSSIYGALPAYMSTAYSRIDVPGLQAAHTAGWTGKGINIEINDRGKHQWQVGYTAEFVAPGAKYDWYDRGNSQYTRNDFTGKADIVNYSFGLATAASSYSTFQGEVNYNPNALHVMAGPNTNTNNCSQSGQTAATCDPSVQVVTGEHDTYSVSGTWIVVGAYDTGTGAYNSPGAGSTTVANHWIVTNGDSIDHSTNGAVQGTSFAAPKVTGAAALVMHKFGTSANDTKTILLGTADDTFTGYSQNTHGHGKLDIGAAMSPVGNLN